MIKKVHFLVRREILNIVDFFYPLFKWLFPLQTYRYAACGGANMALNILLYFISYNFLLRKEILHLGSIAISPHIAAFLMAFVVTFPIGFYLNRYVVFQGSFLRRRTQLIRYFIVVSICILVNYLLLKFFVEYLRWYPTPSMMLTTVLLTIFSYLSQNYFSFRKKSGEQDREL